VPQARILVMSQYDPRQLLPSGYGCVDKGRLADDLLASIKSIADRANVEIRSDMQTYTATNGRQL
jgi:hypothetical protein